jgi:proteic killer suppression protein
VIRSFGDRATEDLACGRKTARVRRFPADLVRPALRKLVALEAAETLDDLRIPAGNRLEPLKGDLAGHYSIRINDQWRVVFRWSDGGADDVRVIDYHR